MLNENHAISYLIQANQHYRQEAYQQAIELYNYEIALNPQSADAHFGKALALNDSGNPEKSLLSFDEAIKIEPYFAEAFFAKSLTLIELGRAKEALRFLICANKLFLKKANEYVNNKNYVEAICYYDQIISTDPHCYDAHLYKGISHSQLMQHDQANSCFDKALSLHSDSLKIAARFELSAEAMVAQINHFSTARQLFEDAHYDKALDMLDEIIMQNSCHGDAFYIQALIHYGNAHYARALTCFDKAKAYGFDDIYETEKNKNFHEELVTRFQEQLNMQKSIRALVERSSSATSSSVSALNKENPECSVMLGDSFKLKR